MGATIAEPVIMAVVPEPWGNLMMTPIMMGIRMPGMPIFTMASAIIPAAPEVLMTAPRAPPAAVIKTMGPASRQASCIRSTQALLPISRHSRKAPMHREMNRAMTGWPRKVMTLATAVPFREPIWPTRVLAKMRTMGMSRVAKDRPAEGSFSVESRSAKSVLSNAWPAFILASILSRTAS